MKPVINGTETYSDSAAPMHVSLDPSTYECQRNIYCVIAVLAGPPMRVLVKIICA